MAFSLAICASFGYAQSDSTIRVQSPYRTEYNPWYKLTVFKRGFHSDSLTVILDDLEDKPRREWSKLDSLNFAKTLLHTGNIKLSEYYFNNLEISLNTEEEYWWDQMMIFIINKDYDAGIESIHKSRLGILENSKLYFLDKILAAYQLEKEDSKWYKTKNVLNWEIDSSFFEIDKNDPQFQTEIIEPLKNLDFVLKEMIHFIHQDDAVIAKTSYEMGIVFEDHISLTQAYILYNLGRHYNKSDKEILNRVKQVKGKLSKKKYKIPNFRKYFPRIEEWRFEYTVLKEKIILEKQDTLPDVKPVLMKKKEKPIVPFRPELIIVFGLLVLFLLVLLFLKTKNK